MFFLLIPFLKKLYFKCFRRNVNDYTNVNPNQIQDEVKLDVSDSSENKKLNEMELKSIGKENNNLQDNDKTNFKSIHNGFNDTPSSNLRKHSLRFHNFVNHEEIEHRKEISIFSQ